MVGAFAFEAYNSRAEFAGGNTLIIAVGFTGSLVCGWFCAPFGAVKKTPTPVCAEIPIRFI
jgi:undecaprenyl pyrophosphate phosphatase UppP